MTTPDTIPEPLDRPGLYYEEEVLQAGVVRAAGRIAITALRTGGQWGVRVYPASFINSSAIPDDAPLLGYIVTDVEGFSEDPRRDEGEGVPRDRVWPITTTWFADRELVGQFESAQHLRGGMYENDAVMGAVLGIQARE